MQDEAVKDFKRMFLYNFAEHCNTRLYTLKYQLLDSVVEDLRKFETLSLPYCSLYEHINVWLKLSYRKPTQRRHGRLLVTVNIL